MQCDLQSCQFICTTTTDRSSILTLQSRLQSHSDHLSFLVSGCLKPLRGFLESILSCQIFPRCKHLPPPRLVKQWISAAFLFFRNAKALKILEPSPASLLGQEARPGAAFLHCGSNVEDTLENGGKGGKGGGVPVALRGGREEGAHEGPARQGCSRGSYGASACGRVGHGHVL